MKLAPIQSLAHLRRKVFADKNYKEFVVEAAKRMGKKTIINDGLDDYDDALIWLTDKADLSGEDELIEDLNFIREELTR
jgi:hypothetical protein